MIKFRCKACLYIHDGAEAPGVCPKCGAPREQFEQLADNAAALIDRSRETNALLVRAASLAGDMQELARRGMDDNLDPSCLYIFQHLDEFSSFLRRMINAEIHSHALKNKWG